MKKWCILKRLLSIFSYWAMVASVLLILVQPVIGSEYSPLSREDFTMVSQQGFGDRQNGWAWGMAWYKGKLYVGTNRAYHCLETRSLNIAFPMLFDYPADDPDVECIPDPDDLPLRAEIWCWTPETDTWKRVYQSPDDLEIPESPGKYVARDVGFRGLYVHREANGTDALYMSGVSSECIHPKISPGRILRTIDGTNFEEIPRDPGTFLGDLDKGSVRGMVSYKKKLFVVVGGIHGHGYVIESADPAQGNDSFRMITPPEFKVMEIATFNGFLYLGLHVKEGYSVVKTDATGEPPYEFIPVVTDGGFKKYFPNKEAISMHEFNGRLYVGTNGMGTWQPAAELIRINPDDTWDLVVGQPRATPEGWKYPLSGLKQGFGWFLNAHMWRMEEFDDRLYVGTFDASTVWKDTWWGQLVAKHMGFDLYSTSDGVYFSKIDDQGFQDKFNFGVRTLQATPYGLFLGTANYYYGLQIWRGVPHELEPSERLSASLNPPQRLEVENSDNAVILSWDDTAGACQYSIFRLDRSFNNGIPQFVEQMIDTTHATFYQDTTTEPNCEYTYYIQAEDKNGNISESSNFVTIPVLAPKITFDYTFAVIKDLVGHDKFISAKAKKFVLRIFKQASFALKQGDVNRTERLSKRLHRTISRNKWMKDKMMESLAAEDMDILLSKLIKRIKLAKAGILSLSDL